MNTWLAIWLMFCGAVLGMVMLLLYGALITAKRADEAAERMWAELIERDRLEAELAALEAEDDDEDWA